MAEDHAGREQREVVKCHCNDCGQPTRHETLCTESHDDMSEGRAPDDYPVGFTYAYSLLRCLGCMSITLRQRSWFSECDRDDPPQETFYPPRVSRRLPKWAEDLDEGMKALMDEVYSALHNGSARLAAMGARTILEMTMDAQLGGDAGSFAKKTNAMVAEGFLARNHKDVLDAALDAGSAAAHRAYRPSDDDINRVMDIVESVLWSTMLADDANSLRENTPTRPPPRSQPGSGSPPAADGSSGRPGLS